MGLRGLSVVLFHEIATPQLIFVLLGVTSGLGTFPREKWLERNNWHL